MKKLSLVLVVFVAAAVFGWKARVSAEPAEKPSADTIKQFEAEFLKASVEKGSAGYLSFYADDAVELPNGADAIVGKANIAKTMGFLDDKNNHLTWSPVSAGISASGDLGYTWGTYEFRSKQKDANEFVEHGKYMTLWKKQPDGSWKVAVDMGNTVGPRK
jgi:ketosteroid isomerase-like protein